jgi:hypothetical protein
MTVPRRCCQTDAELDHAASNTPPGRLLPAGVAVMGAVAGVLPTGPADVRMAETVR